jgi:hypothetical protein
MFVLRGYGTEFMALWEGTTQAHIRDFDKRITLMEK